MSDANLTSSTMTVILPLHFQLCLYKDKKKSLLFITKQSCRNKRSNGDIQDW